MLWLRKKFTIFKPTCVAYIGLRCSPIHYLVNQWVVVATTQQQLIGRVNYARSHLTDPFEISTLGRIESWRRLLATAVAIIGVSSIKLTPQFLFHFFSSLLSSSEFVHAL